MLISIGHDYWKQRLALIKVCRQLDKQSKDAKTALVIMQIKQKLRNRE